MVPTSFVNVPASGWLARTGGRVLEAMRFNALEPLPGGVRAAYRLSVNEFNGAQSLQLVIEHWERREKAAA